MKLIEVLKEEFIKRFNHAPNDVFSVPGRIELLGNHTDHNDGLVLVSAVDKKMHAVVGKNEASINLYSEGFPSISLAANEYQKRPQEKGLSISLIRGILFHFQQRGYAIGGFDLIMDSDIDRGAGMSSSAAFELLIANILNHYYNKDRISPMELAIIAQNAEIEYFEKPCGLLDQVGIAFGGVNYIDFASNITPIIKNIRFSLKGYTAVITNTGGSHWNLTKFYTEIKDDMQKVSAFFDCQTLREVEYQKFIQDLPLLRKVVGGRAILRAYHFFEENIRVGIAYQAILKNEAELFLQMINESGISSYDLLQNCYYPGDSEQGITLGLTLSKKLIKDGAVRVHGGGFSGTILAFIANSEVDNYIKQMQKVFGEKNIFKVDLELYHCPQIEEIKNEEKF